MVFAPDRCSQTPPPSDTLRRAQNGDADALNALLEPYWNTVFRLAYRMVGHAEDAEDLAQEIFVRVIRRLPTFRGESAFETWIYRIAVNVCLTARQKPKRTVPLDLEAAPSPQTIPGLEERMLQRAFQERIREEIHRLRPSYREVLLLRLIEERTYPEIAERLQIPVKAAQLRFHRGMKRLRERLQPWMNEEIE